MIEGLVAAMLTLAAHMTGYPPVTIDDIQVYVVSQEDLEILVYGHELEDDSRFYPLGAADQNSMYLLEGSDPADLKTQAVVLHESVHILQWFAMGEEVFQETCRGEIEREAYNAHFDYLQNAAGLTRDEAFELMEMNPITLMFITTCWDQMPPFAVRLLWEDE